MTKNKFYKILTTEGATEATIMLYDYIGEYYEWSPETGYTKEGITDLDFVQELNRLAEKHSVIHLRINSPGGDMFHGNAIMTAIAGCKAEIHTWNDGVAASLAADIWLCGHVRHMAKNALLMIHPAWNVCIGHAQAMRECADVLDKFSESAIIATAASTGISEDDMRARYYADYKDHWLTFNDAVKDGLVTDTTEYEAAALPAAAEKMTYKQLLDHFQKSQHPDAPGLAERLKNIWEKTLATFTTHKSASPVGKQTQPNLDMNIEELKKSLADGTLTPEAVAQALTEAAQPATPSAAATDSDAALAAAQKQMADDLAAVKEQNTALVAQMKKLEETLVSYGAQPGATKSQPSKPDGDPPIGEPDDATKALDSFNKAVAEAANTHDNPFKKAGAL